MAVKSATKAKLPARGMKPASKRTSRKSVGIGRGRKKTIGVKRVKRTA